MDTYEEILKENQRYIVKIASSFGIDDEHLLEDLIQEGRIGLLEAYNQFDEAKGVPFMKYAGFIIKNKMMTYMTKFTRTIRLPDNIVYKIRKDDYTTVSGYPIIYHPTISTEHVIANQNNRDLMIKDIIPNESQTPDYEYIHKAIESIEDPKWKDIIKRHYGFEPYEKAQYLREIAEAYGISREAVRQKIIRIENKLKKTIKR